MGQIQGRNYTLIEGCGLHEITTQDGRTFSIHYAQDPDQAIAFWDDFIEEALHGLSESDDRTAQDRLLTAGPESGPICCTCADYYEMADEFPTTVARILQDADHDCIVLIDDPAEWLAGVLGESQFSAARAASGLGSLDAEGDGSEAVEAIIAEAVRRTMVLVTGRESDPAEKTLGEGS